VLVDVRIKEHSFSREDTRAMFQRFLVEEWGKENMAAQADRSRSRGDRHRLRLRLRLGGSNGESQPRNRTDRDYDLPGSQH
jgi:hypothetical protein